MSMVHGHNDGNGPSSGQGSRPVRWSLQMINSYTNANLPVSVYKWPCRICPRVVSFRRPQELERHIQLIHLPCWIFCPYSHCDWRGCRLDEFQTHLNQRRCDQNSPALEYRIYDVRWILDMIRRAESDDSIRNAQNCALRFVHERAIELGKDRWIMDLWGERERRERRMSRG